MSRKPGYVGAQASRSGFQASGLRETLQPAGIFLMFMFGMVRFFVLVRVRRVPYACW